VSHAEEDALRKVGEGAGEMIAVRADLNAKIELVKTLKSEASEYQAKLDVSETQRVQAERQRADVVAQKEAISATLQIKEDLIASLQRTSDEKQHGLGSQLTQARQKLHDVNVDLETARATVMQREAEAASLKSQLDSSGSSLSKLQIQYGSLQKDLEEVTAKLNAEILSNQERKKKVKEYVTQLTAEKNALEDRLTQSEQQFRESHSGRGIAEQNLQLLEMKIAKAGEQAQLEKEQMERESEATITSLKTEVESLQRLVDTYNQGTVEKVEEAYKQVC
jgi:chromosome segregation ATPase